MSSTNGPMTKIGGAGRGQALHGRRGSLLAAAVAAIVAAGLIYAFVSSYNKSSAPPATPVATTSTVWVAKGVIAAGTPYAQVIAQGMLERQAIPTSQVIAGAISDPSVVAGQVVKTDVAAGQQVTTADFSSTFKATLGTQLIGDYRAVAFPLDAAHGLTAYVIPGSHVDIMGQDKATSQMLVQDVEVLANSGGVMVLRLTDKQSLLLTAATGKDALWLSLRPVRGAKQSIRLGDQESL